MQLHRVLPKRQHHLPRALEERTREMHQGRLERVRTDRGVFGVRKVRVYVGLVEWKGELVRGGDV